MIPALTVRQPWASAFFQRPVDGAKDIENRTWATQYRGPLAIHAARSVDRAGLDFLGSHGFDHELDRGVILGTVELVDCHVASPEACEEWRCTQSPWAFWPTNDAPRIVHWRVEHPREFVTPIRETGHLQLWEAGPSAQHLMTIAELVP